MSSLPSFDVSKPVAAALTAVVVGIASASVFARGPTAEISGLEFFEQVDGCPFVSGDGGELGCLEHRVEEGRVDTWLKLYSVEHGRSYKSFLVLTDQATDVEATAVPEVEAPEGSGLRAEAVALANKHLKRFGFERRDAQQVPADEIEAKAETFALECDGERHVVERPKLSGAERSCCKWRATRGVCVGGEALVFGRRDCQIESGAGEGACKEASRETGGRQERAIWSAKPPAGRDSASKEGQMAIKGPPDDRKVPMNAGVSETFNGQQEESGSDDEEKTTSTKESEETEEYRPIPEGATLTYGEMSAKGGISREILGRVFGQHRREALFCYEKQLKQNPKLTGELTVGLTVGPSGDVVAARTVEQSFDSDVISTCVTGKVRRWVFPEPDGGGVVEVELPMRFSVEQ